MNARILTALISALTLGGCIIHEYPDHGSPGDAPAPAPAPTYPGDVSFLWSFAGQSCLQMPQVRSVAVSIPGERLENGGVFPCRTMGTDGIRLSNFAPGAYGFTLQALGNGGEELFAGSGSFRVDGDVSVRADLLPVAGPNTYAYVLWRFPGYGSCAEAGIETVEVSIDGGLFETHRCEDGMFEPGVPTPMLEAGRHTIEIVALDAWGYDWFVTHSVLETRLGQPIAAEYSLQWSVGGAAVAWQLSDGVYGESCWEAGVDTVYVNFEDEAGNMLFAGAGDAQPCDSGPALYVLPPGNFQVYVTATGPWGALYESNGYSPPAVSVVAGSFPDAAFARAIQLYRVY